LDSSNWGCHVVGGVEKVEEGRGGGPEG